MAIDTLISNPKTVTQTTALDEPDSSNVDTSNTNRVILLNVDIKVRNLLTGSGTGQLRFEELASTSQMFFELEEKISHVDAIVLGVQHKEPVRIAQRIHSMGMDIPLLILTEPERYEQLKQVLKFAPFLNNDVMPWSTDSLDQLQAVLLETVKRTQKRRAYRGSIAAAQKRLGDVHRMRPQITHYLDHLLDHVPIGEHSGREDHRCFEQAQLGPVDCC